MTQVSRFKRPVMCKCTTLSLSLSALPLFPSRKSRVQNNWDFPTTDQREIAKAGGVGKPTSTRPHPALKYLGRSGNSSWPY